MRSRAALTIAPMLRRRDESARRARRTPLGSRGEALEGPMRYLVDLAVFVGVFLLGLTIFKSGAVAVLAAIVVSGAAESLMGSAPKR